MGISISEPARDLPVRKECDVLVVGGGPAGCLYPNEVSNLLAAGRCISVDHRVHHSTKEIPACIATGEAAGTAAAMAVAQGIAPRALKVGRLQEQLIKQGASLGL